MKKFKGKQSEINQNSKEKKNESTGLNAGKILGAGVATGALVMTTGLGISQTLVNKNEYKKIVAETEQKVANVGESSANYIYGGNMQRAIQTEIEKQNSEHGDKYANDKFSVFQDEGNQAKDKEYILNVKEIEDALKNDIDSIVSKELGEYYRAFHEFHEAGTGLVGYKKGRYGENGWNIIGFPRNIHIDFLEKNKDLPYNRKNQELLQAKSEKIRKDELDIWAKQAEKNRKSMTVAEYESADLLSLAETQKRIINKLRKEIIKDEMNRITKQYYGNRKNEAKSNLFK